MFPFLLYFLTSALIGLPIFLLSGITNTIAGDAGFALLGSVLLALAGFLGIVRPRVAALVAVVATSGIWPVVGGSLVVILSEGEVPDVSLVFFNLLLLGTTVYAVLVGFKIKALGTRPTWLFPGNASLRAQIAVGSLIGLVIVVSLIAYVFFLGTVSETVTYDMTWSYPHRRELVLSYRDYPGYYQVCYSDELVRYLQSTGRSQVPVVFEVITDFGKIRKYRVKTVGEWENNEFRCNSGGWNFTYQGGSGSGSDSSSLFMQSMSPKRVAD